MSKKQSSGWKEGTNNIDTTVRLKDGDKRRDKRNCLNYNRDNKKCNYRNGECIGSSHCAEYREDESKKKKKKVIKSKARSRHISQSITSSSIVDNNDLFVRTLREAQCYNLQSMYQVAQYYEVGKGVEQNYILAMKWYKEAFQKSNKYGAVAIGNLYENGLGTAKNLNEALKWYEKGEAVNEPGAKKRVERLKKIIFTSNDIQKADQIISSPKKKDIPIIDSWLLGKRAYQNQQWNEAYKYLGQAAKTGNVEAICMLADMYYEGLGSQSKDDKKAFQYYHQAAEQKNVHAMHRLGLLYLWGEGTEQSNKNAVTWLKKAWDEGAQSAKDDYDLAIVIGNNFDKALDSAQIQHTPTYGRNAERHQKTKSNRRQILIFSLIIITMVLAFCFLALYRRPVSVPVQPRKMVQSQSHFINKNVFGTPDNPYIMTAEELMGRYNDNPKETEKNYIGKYIKLTGTVVRIGKFNNSNNRFICMYFWKHGNSFYKVAGDVPFKNKQWLETIQVGDSVTLTGYFIGAVQQKNNNVVFLQIIVTQPPGK